MPDQEDIDNLVSAFNDSFLSMFFPNIENEFGQALLASVAEYVLSCYPDFLRDCPKIWIAFAIHKVALVLVNWNITVGDTSVVIGTPAPSSGAETFLKSRKIGEKTCTFEQIKNPTNTGNSPVDSWKLKADGLLRTCKMASQEIFVGGGSNWPDCVTDCGCEEPSPSHKVKR